MGEVTEQIERQDNEVAEKGNSGDLKRSLLGIAGLGVIPAILLANEGLSDMLDGRTTTGSIKGAVAATIFVISGVLAIGSVDTREMKG